LKGDTCVREFCSQCIQSLDDRMTYNDNSKPHTTTLGRTRATMVAPDTLPVESSVQILEIAIKVCLVPLPCQARAGCSVPLNWNASSSRSRRRLKNDPLVLRCVRTCQGCPQGARRAQRASTATATAQKRLIKSPLPYASPKICSRPSTLGAQSNQEGRSRSDQKPSAPSLP